MDHKFNKPYVRGGVGRPNAENTNLEAVNNVKPYLVSQYVYMDKSRLPDLDVEGKTSSCKGKKKSEAGKNRRKSSEVPNKNRSPKDIHDKHCEVSNQISLKNEISGNQKTYIDELLIKLKNGPTSGSTVEMLRKRISEEWFNPKHIEEALSVLITEKRALHLGYRYVATEGSQIRLPVGLAKDVKKFIQESGKPGTTYGNLKASLNILSDEQLRGELVTLFMADLIWMKKDKIIFKTG
ncbi:hypothetical protein AVEN_255776-1 [Araneus ventricosus]|uniref:Uncharacterized protein n=1 Tax=Araneus ventricosus TaxID=182803 RepID=A0A4Y2P5Q0_ARAVE|nr:hypothetical protein AVEN_255776-1 [Araneus ventricosus]